jgi:NAD(P)-dependent dehydrogenase (short-subunit alcohol dehydrogenase family)
MDLGLSGRRALITGASKGIGFASAKQLAAEGCAVTLVARSASDLKTAADEIWSTHQVPVEIRPLDITAKGAIESLHADLSATDILVNNAGAVPLGSINELDDERWRAGWELKVFGYINVTRAAYPLMKARRSGVIVNVIGHAGENLSATYIAGGSGCAALMALTRALGAASPADGIRVVGINPGPVLTERLLGFLRARAETTLGDPERWQELVSGMPFGRTGKPEEIASAVAFLASDRSGYTTGTIVTVDGGVSSQGKSWL